MHTSKSTESLTSIVIFQYHLVRRCKLEIHAIGGPSDIHTGYGHKKSLQRELNMIHTYFAILNSHVTFMFKIYQKHKFLFGKAEKF